MQQARGSRFGQHLKQLREERRLTLEQVEELSIPYKNRISTAYLSRCENGKTRPTIERLAVLSKIYKASFGPLAERLVAEQEFRDSTPVDLTGRTPDDLLLEGNRHLEHGELKVAHAFYAAAEDLAALSESSDRKSATSRAKLSMAVALQLMGRYQLAKEEAERALSLISPESLDAASALMVLAICHYRLGNEAVSEIFVARLRHNLEKLPVKDQADVHLLAGNLLEGRGDYSSAVKDYRMAATQYRDVKNTVGQAAARKNAALCYRRLDRLDSAVRQIDRALKHARAADDKRELASVLLESGIIALRSKGAKAARLMICEAIDLARRGDYFDTLFASYYYLRKIEQDLDPRAVKTIERTLRQLLPKLEEDLEEAREFQLEFRNNDDV